VDRENTQRGGFLWLLGSSQVLEILGISHNTMHRLVVLRELLGANVVNYTLHGCEMQLRHKDYGVICHLRQWN